MNEAAHETEEARAPKEAAHETEEALAPTVRVIQVAHETEEALAPTVRLSGWTARLVLVSGFVRVNEAKAAHAPIVHNRKLADLRFHLPVGAVRNWPASSIRKIGV